MIYLDTHVLVWLYAGQTERFPARVRELLNTHVLLASPILALELRYLYEIQRISVSEETLMNDLKTQLGLRYCEQPFEAVVAAAMQHSWTRDPFERLIVAQASLQQAVLLTRDQTILKHYPLAQWD